MKRSIISGIVVLVILVAGYGIYEFFQYKTITFDIKQSVEKVDIYRVESDNENPESIASATNGQVVKLRAGHYYYVPRGKTIAAAPSTFSVADHMTITVDPDFSSEYLESLVSSEQPKLHEVLIKRFPAQMEHYNTNNVKLFGKADRAGILLVPNTMDPQSPGGYYRVLAQKKSNTWEIIGKPEIVLTKYNTPNIPVATLKAVNDLSLR